MALVAMRPRLGAVAIPRADGSVLTDTGVLSATVGRDVPVFDYTRQDILGTLGSMLAASAPTAPVTRTVCKGVSRRGASDWVKILQEEVAGAVRDVLRQKGLSVAEFDAGAKIWMDESDRYAVYVRTIARLGNRWGVGSASPNPSSRLVLEGQVISSPPGCDSWT